MSTPQETSNSQAPAPAPVDPKAPASVEVLETAGSPGIFWRPLQKLRAKLHLIPSVETEIIAQLQILQGVQISVLNRRSLAAHQNFKQILAFIELTNKNMANNDTNGKMMLERIRNIEKVLRLRQEDEPDDGSYVQ